MTITSRPIRGNEHESDWPPLFGNGGAGLYHVDEETGELREGYPPSKIEKFGEAPFVIGDTIEAYYHPAAEMWTESRSALNHMDKATGCITTDKKLAPIPHNRQKYERERAEDHHRCLRRAVEAVDAGTAPLTEETKALCKEQNEIVSSALNFDAFNVAGRKNDKRGKRFKRK